MHSEKRIWADIDLSAIDHNFKVIKSAVGDAKVLAVVKADGYGHGALQSALTLEACGADYFGVATTDEALELRDGGITAPILIFGRTAPEDMHLLSKHNITQTVYDLEYARTLSGYAAQSGNTVKAHLKVDTGMSRLGFFCRDTDSPVLDDICTSLSLDGINYEGIFTHFAASDEKDGAEFTKHQFALFKDLIAKLHEKGFDFAIRHAANSGAVLSYPDTYLDMVRPGLILYGLYPDPQIHGTCEGLIPAMSLRSTVSMVKTVPANTPIGYGGHGILSCDASIATVSAGYADGYPTLLSGKGELLVCGKRAKIAGRVCMDQLMIDVTGIEGVCEGGSAELFGKEITADEVAEKSGLLNYEITCAVSKRVPRFYHK